MKRFAECCLQRQWVHLGDRRRTGARAATESVVVTGAPPMAMYVHGPSQDFARDLLPDGAMAPRS